MCLINVDDALAGQKLIDEPQCELLPLVEAADAVRAHPDGLDTLEREAKLLLHHAVHKPLAETARQATLNMAMDLSNARNGAIPLK